MKLENTKEDANEQRDFRDFIAKEAFEVYDNKETLNEQLGEHVIIRTYSAGVHFGILSKKMKNEVILLNSRRLFRFMCPESISLSDVALNGVDQSRSRICAEIPKIWLEAIEIISVTEKCIESIKTSPVATQE